jgi:hypothetical protein
MSRLGTASLDYAAGSGGSKATDLAIGGSPEEC